MSGTELIAGHQVPTRGRFRHRAQVGADTAALASLHELILAHVLPAERLHGDDTTVPVLAKGKTITGRLWAYACATVVSALPPALDIATSSEFSERADFFFALGYCSPAAYALVRPLGRMALARCRGRSDHLAARLLAR